jgi:hypothetical protein
MVQRSSQAPGSFGERDDMHNGPADTFQGKPVPA